MGQQQHGFGRTVVAALGLPWTRYPHTRLFLGKTGMVVASRGTAELASGTRIRTMEVDTSPRLARSTTHFTVEAGGVRGVRLT